MAEKIADEIANEIRGYKCSEKPGWWKTGEYVRIFCCIRKALYDDEITLTEYNALMSMLGID